MSGETTQCREPCIRCGDETAAGTRLFSHRRVIPDVGSGTATAYLCGHCHDEVHRARQMAHLTDTELRRLIEDGGIAGQTYAAQGPAGFVGPT